MQLGLFLKVYNFNWTVFALLLETVIIHVTEDIIFLDLQELIMMSASNTALGLLFILYLV